MNSDSARRYHMILNLIGFPFYLFLGLARWLKLIPRTYVVIGGSIGHAFNDNTKYLYLQLHEDPTVIWLTHSIKVQAYLQTQGLRCERLWSWSGVQICCSAKRFIISHNPNDLSPIFMLGIRVTHLFHGIPLKKIGFDTDNWQCRTISCRLKNALKRLLFFAYPHLNYMYCDELVYSGDTKNMLSAFRISLNQVLDYGFSRYLAFNDDFYQRHQSILDNDTLRQLTKQRSEGKTIIVYAPTHRQQLKADPRITEQVEQLLELVSNLQNVILVYKAHFTSFPVTRSNIISYPDPDPYPLLHITDILISDYSSMIFDFLLLDRPIILFAYDLIDYQKKVGLYFDYEQIAPGQICREAEEVAKQLQLELEDKNITKALRESCKQIVFNDCLIKSRGVYIEKLKQLLATP
jgi:CDP-glycerol glycerophosphotransferase (TagB/SpsB family)